MSKIIEVTGLVIHDSRGDDTVQATVKTEAGGVGSAAVPAGASKSAFEAKVVEPAQAVSNIQSKISPVLVGLDALDQRAVDQAMIKLDGTEDKRAIGANAILAVSMAVSRAAAAEKHIPLYKHIGSLDNRKGFSIPIPMFNLINGGKHADNNLDIQEFMVVPDKIEGYRNQLSAGKLIHSTLGQMLKKDSVFLPTGDEGGFAPNLDTNEMAFDFLVKAVKESGYKPWEEVSLGLDVAASSLPRTFEISTKRYLGLLRDYPILSIEDPFLEDDWASWSQFNQEMEQSNPTHKKLLLVGDDVFATNPQRLKDGIEKKAANAILVKLNQIGTVSETIDVVEIARTAGYVNIISHRSGETLDDYIADFAVGVGAQFIKTGAPNDSHPERMVKYQRLLAIERELSGNAK